MAHDSHLQALIDRAEAQRQRIPTLYQVRAAFARDQLMRDVAQASAGLREKARECFRRGEYAAGVEHMRQAQALENQYG